eukprot:4836057-Alexandrium_andersonii.AAC.1
MTPARGSSQPVGEVLGWTVPGRGAAMSAVRPAEAAGRSAWVHSAGAAAPVQLNVRCRPP